MSLERDGSILCRSTGLLLRPEGSRARLVEPGTGKPLPWPEEESAVRQAAEVARQAAEERNRTLESEVARLRAELERSRKQG